MAGVEGPSTDEVVPQLDKLLFPSIAGIAGLWANLDVEIVRVDTQ